MDIRVLATQLYLDLLEERLGISLGKIERELKGMSHIKGAEYWQSAPRELYRKRRGYPITNLKMINKIEKILDGKAKGSKRIIFHPLWEILEEPKADLDQVREMMTNLEPGIMGRLFLSDRATNELSRKKLKHPSQLRRIEKLSSIDALAALIMLIREQELLENWELYNQAKWGAHRLLMRLGYFWPNESLTENIIRVVFDRFINPNNPINLGPHPILGENYPQLLNAPYKHPLFSWYRSDTSNMIKNAVAHGLVTETKEEQIDFLFWVQTFCNQDTIEEELITLKHGSPLTRKLENLVDMINGDSRIYLNQ